MTTEIEAPGTGLGLGVAADEAHARRAVELQLQRAFPSVPVDQVEILVECLWAHFDAAPVRDFVPLLVEKQAKEELLDHFGHRPEP